MTYLVAFVVGVLVGAYFNRSVTGVIDRFSDKVKERL
jgi:hypothetical protein